MNLNMIQPKSETEDLLFSITKNCEMLIEQTHRKAEETLEFKMNKSREIFHISPPIQVKGGWMIGLTDLEVYNSISNITEENNKFELYKFPDGKAGSISYIKVTDEIERDLDIEDITAQDLQDEIIAPIIIKENNEQVTKRMKDDGYMDILARYTSSVFQDFESFLRTEVDLVEDDIKLVLDEYNSSFITHELEPGIYTFKDISETLFIILQSDCPGDCNVIVIEYDDINMKTKLVVQSGIIAIRFDEKSFFSTILGFTAGWDYKHYNKYTIKKIVNLGSINKIHLKIYIQPYISDDNFRTSNVAANDIGYNLYVFDIRYQKDFTNSQPIKVEFKFDGVVPNDINGYALVLTNKLISISSDGQRMFDLI